MINNNKAWFSMDDIQKENNATNVNILFFILIKSSSPFRNICTNEDM